MINKLLTLALAAALLAGCASENNNDTLADNPVNTDADSLRADSLQPQQAISDIALDTAHFEYEDGVLRLTWKMLTDVVFTDEYSEEVQAYVPYPTFGAQLQAIEGREVLIEGYIIPLEETGDETILVLSAQPYSSCFFCGGAGPESVMDIKLRPDEKRKFTTDDRMTFRGKLRLNDDDLYYLNYILEDAAVHP
jgi:outer membrane murein-binding lipoprotein Lpp